MTALLPWLVGAIAGFIARFRRDYRRDCHQSAPSPADVYDGVVGGGDRAIRDVICFSIL